MEKSKSINWVLLSVVGVVLFVMVWVGARVAFPERPTIFAGTQPSYLGVEVGKLAPCPSTPNCVSSESEDTEHYIKPLVYQNLSAKEAIALLKQVILQQKGAKIINETDNYIYAQFTSRWLGFVDDVEFLVGENAGEIEVTSASRLGESDLGVNRKRVENIRYQLNQLYSMATALKIS